MNQVRLRDFDNSWFHPGRSILWQAFWLFCGLPLLRSPFVLSSSFRVHLLRFFGASIGSGIVIKPGVRVKYPWKLSVGNDCWIGEDCWIDNLVPVRLGNDVCVSQGVYFCTGNHDWSDPTFGLIVKEIVLQDGSWAGAKSVLAPGVTIETCGIAAAGSVITKNIPAYEVHAGNPAAFVRRRHIRTSQPESVDQQQKRVSL